MPQLFLPPDSEGLAPALRGFARAHEAHLVLSEDPVYFTARDRSPVRRVALVSGGGSGHEPLHAGFLGPGLLDAVAPGEVFASPHNRQVYEASRAVALDGGVLHIVKNYTGDKINFGIAAERLRADGIRVGRVLVHDDVATESDETATGRRGTGATVLVEKILGAAADRGADLDELVALGDALAARVRSVAVASESLTSVHTGERIFELADGDLEYGVGIHGERAATTMPYTDLRTLVARMLDDVMASLGSLSGDALVLVNGLGSASPLELYAVFDALARQLDDRGIAIGASLVGTLVSALDMHGFSVTVLDVADPAWWELWRAGADAPAWKETNR